MKRYLYILTALLLVTAACKKDRSKPADDGQTYQVKFNVGFSQEITDIKDTKRANSLATNAVDTALSNHVNTIAFYLYNSAGSLVKSVTQKSTDADFGKFSGALPNGSYTAIFAAGDKGMYFGSTTKLADAYVVGSNAETFAKQIVFNVNDSSIQQPVVLNRITSKITLTVTDQLPAKVNYCRLDVQGGSLWQFSTGNVSQSSPGNFFSTLVVDFPIKTPGITNYKITRYVTINGPMVVRAFFAEATSKSVSSSPDIQTILANKLINFTAGPNSVINLSGSIFGGNPSEGNAVKVSVDSTWNAAPINVNF